MYAKEVTITNPTGLHARPASEFVQAASKFKSNITIRRVDQESTATANAKSILILLSLGLVSGATVEIAAEGEDEVEAVDTLCDLIANLKD